MKKLISSLTLIVLVLTNMQLALAVGPTIGDIFISKPAFDPDLGSQKFTYEIESPTGFGVFVTANVHKVSTGTIVKKWDSIPSSNGQNILEWEGKISGIPVNEGEYQFLIQINGTNESETANFNVVEAPFVNSASVSDTIYDPTTNEDIKFSFVLGDAVKTEINAVIMPKTDLFKKLPQDYKFKREWNLTNQTNGIKEFFWDGKDSFTGQFVADDEYIFVYSAKNGNSQVVEGNLIFNVVTSDANIEAVEDFGVVPPTFSPNDDGSNDVTEISFKAKVDHIVYIDILDENDDIIRSIVDDVDVAVGDHSFEWDGKNNGGNVVENANYKVRLKSKVNNDITEKLASVTVSNPNQDSDSDSDQDSDSDSDSDSDADSDSDVDSDSDADCGTFKDVPQSHAHYDAIMKMNDLEIMTGNPDCTWGPNDNVQRDQMAKIALEAFNKYVKGKDYCLGKAAFSDVPKIQWSYQYICRGKALKMITGYLDGQFKGLYVPGNPVNRAEFVTLVLRNVTDTMNEGTAYEDVNPASYYGKFAKYVKDNNLLFSGNKFSPNTLVKRWEVAEFLAGLEEMGELN